MPWTIPRHTSRVHGGHWEAEFTRHPSADAREISLCVYGPSFAKLQASRLGVVAGVLLCAASEHVWDRGQREAHAHRLGSWGLVSYGWLFQF